MPAGNPAPSRAHRELALPLRRHKDRPRFGRLHDCGLGELGFAGGHREYRRLAPPLAEKDHLPHDILVGQHAPGVLAVPDGDLDRAAESSASELSRKGGSEPLRPDVDSALSPCALASIRALRRPSRPPIGRAPNDDVAVSFAHILSELD